MDFRRRERWMAEFEALTIARKPQRRADASGKVRPDFWDTATFLFNEGLSPADAVERLSA